MRTARPLAALLAVALCSVGSSREALAQAPAAKAPAAPSAPSADQIAKAKTLFDLGAKAYDSEQFPAAIQAFEEAYRLSARPGPIFSAAQAYRRLYNTDRKVDTLRKAIENYKLYIEKQKAGGRIAEAQQSIRDLEPLLVQAQAAAASNPEPETPAAAATDTKPRTRLMVSSSTKGALASLDGGEPAELPLIQELTPGPHKLRLAADGFFDDEREIVAFDGQIYGLDISLREKPALLTIRADSGAAVSIDGRNEGTTPLPKPIEVASGTHLVTLTRTGYRPYSVEIDFRRDERRPLDVQMEQTTQRYAALGFLGAAGAGLIAGGIFTGIAFAQQGRAQSIETQMGTRNLTEQERADHDSAVTSRDEMRIGAIGAFAGTTLLALIGTGLFIFDRSTPGLPTKLRDDTPAPPQAKRAPKVGFTAIPSFGPTGGGMTVELRF